MAEIETATIEIDGVPFHYARCGTGEPLLLLHGWPEFWLTWKKVMERLDDRFMLIAPDLRGFGQSGHPDPAPSDQAGAEIHGTDMLALADALGLDRFGIVSHDVGAYAAQSMARRVPDRITGLFFFGCPYPGIGARWAAPEHLKEIWYQSFHQLPWAAGFVGASREACRTYIGHFLTHWSVRKDAFDGVFEDWIDNFMSRGNLQGGFNWYRSANAARIAAMQGKAKPLPPITVPARVRWGAGDPVLKAEWTDRLGETFAQLDYALLEGLGHFPHMEDPDRAAREIREFFSRP